MYFVDVVPYVIEQLGPFYLLSREQWDSFYKHLFKVIPVSYKTYNPWTIDLFSWFRNNILLVSAQVPVNIPNTL